MIVVDEEGSDQPDPGAAANVVKKERKRKVKLEQRYEQALFGEIF